MCRYLLQLQFSTHVFAFSSVKLHISSIVVFVLERSHIILAQHYRVVHFINQHLDLNQLITTLSNHNQYMIVRLHFMIGIQQMTHLYKLLPGISSMNNLISFIYIQKNLWVQSDLLSLRILVYNRYTIFYTSLYFINFKFRVNCY